MKKLFCLMFALCLMASCAFAEEDLLSQIKERGTLIIATEGNWSPWTYHDETTGELTGLDIEIGTLIAEGLGVEPDFRETAWDSILAGVDAGRFDIACNGVGYTETRAEAYNFSTPYVYTHSVLVVRSDNEDIRTIDDLNGKKTSNSPGSTYATIAENHGATVTYVDTLGETMEMLLYGRVDATLNAQESVMDYLREHPEAGIKIVQVLEGEPVAYPIRKTVDEAHGLLSTDSFVEAVNAILDEARADGRLSEISIKYFGIDLTQEN